MKILFVSPIDTAYITRNIEILEELGHHVTQVRYRGKGNPIQKLKAIRSFFAEIKQGMTGNYDLINVQYPFLASWPLVGRSTDIPIVTTLHGTDVVFDKGLKPKQLTRSLLKGKTEKLLQKSALVMVNTRVFKKYVLDHYDVGEENIVVHPTAGFNPAVFNPRGRRQPKEHELVIGMVGRITEQKGWKVLLEAMNLLVDDDNTRYHLKIAGSGPDLGALKRAAREYNAGSCLNRIEVFGKFDHGELGDFYRGVDVLAFPTLYFESLGLVGIESLASGTPVIGSGIGGLVEYIREGENGYLFSPGNARELAMCLSRFAGLTPRARSDLSKRAAQSVEAYSAEVLKPRLEAILQRVDSGSNKKDCLPEGG